MADALRHRGPDDEGIYRDARVGLVLSFRRLAIIDLSRAGHQPMTSVCSRYVIIFNGEIYNHRDLRKLLERDITFRGHSDTEVILAGITTWGISDTVKRLNGMFGLAVWDLHTRTLTLARDRFGEKPLYYGHVGEDFVFGSELKALRQGFRRNPPSIDRGALTLYMRHGYIPAPYTVYDGIFKLMPGTMLEVVEATAGSPSAYWSAADVAAAGVADPLAGSEEDLEEQLHELLLDAIGMRMEADVPLGAFLSGGIDSSTVVALMQAQSPWPVKTYSIGFTDQGYDEAVFARGVATHLGTDHHELYVTPAEAQAVVPQLPTMFDEPFADSSQIPTHLVSKMARESVTVSLSGDGGDELFGGYSRYSLLADMWGRIDRVPRRARELGSAGLTGVSARAWDATFRAARPLLPARARIARPGERLHKLASVLRLATSDEAYLRLVSQWPEPESVIVGGHEPPTALTTGTHATSLSDPALRAMMLDALTYLPDDILVKVDRAAMAVSLETRVPLLDHRLYEFAWRLPSGLRMRPGQGKFLLRKVLDRHVPRELFERPKMGFGVPIGAWLRGPLREWAEDLLSAEMLDRSGLMHGEVVRSAWREHCEGKTDRSYQLWCALMLQAWLDQQGLLGSA